jgi:hydroxymethylpyrimidine/phosphomethylpyrimidine kinase
MNCRFNNAIEDALGILDGPVVEIDRTMEPKPDEEGETMQWAARRAFEAAAGTPVAVFDRGAIGKEAVTRVLARDRATASSRLQRLADAISE